jgi:hypothetical protein
MVTWRVTWTSTVDDDVRTEPDAYSATDITREINEVQTVIVD